MTQTDALTGVITVEQRIVRKVLTTDPPLTFTITVEYVPEDNGFGAWCEEMEAAGWGETLEEALNELAEEMWDFAEVLVERAKKVTPKHKPLELPTNAKRKPSQRCQRCCQRLRLRGSELR